MAKKSSRKKPDKKKSERANDTWPSEPEWRQSGLCAEAQADGVPCTELGRHCEICERAQKEARS